MSFRVILKHVRGCDDEVDCYRAVCDRSAEVLCCVCQKDTVPVSLSVDTDRSTPRTKDQVKRSGAQTIPLKEAKQGRLNL
jgi:hypothetical protein